MMLTLDAWGGKLLSLGILSVGAAKTIKNIPKSKKKYNIEQATNIIKSYY